jgi:hypothetical protein
MSLATVTDWAGLAVTAAGVVAALGGLFYAGRQLRHSRRSAHGTFLLDLEEMLRHHDAVHAKLDSEGGELWKPTETEWPAVEAYMSVFERIQVLVEEGILTLEEVDRLYSYRVLSIVSNASIHQMKLVEKGEFWPDFCKLRASLQELPYWQRNVAFREKEAGSRRGESAA